MRALVELSLAPEYRSGHDALYGGVNRGRLDVSRLRRALAGLDVVRLCLQGDATADRSPDRDRGFSG